MLNRSPARTVEPGHGSALGAWIRATRTEQGISQRALADRSGLSRSYLCDIERGRGAQPSVATLDKLAGALGASRTDLLRAAGVLEPLVGSRESDAERRLLAVVCDLTDDGRAAVERFARFVHADEHRWVQPRLLDGLGDPDDTESAGFRPPQQSGPTLFDAPDNSADVMTSWVQATRAGDG